jgi:peptide-methionine (S)-S-oxide reductase
MLDALLFGRKKTTMIEPDSALPGRLAPSFAIPDRHAVLGTPLQGPFPPGLETAVFGLGCFWGAEQIFWNLPGVYSTAAAYAGGYTPNPTYEEVCSGKTGHAEVVQVVYDTVKISYDDLLKVFWESHDPTQGMRQGNDLGTQYRSAIYTTTPEQQTAAEMSRDAYNSALRGAGFDEITTEIVPAGPIYLAEDYHQQYLHKVLRDTGCEGYCPHTSTGVGCPAWNKAPEEAAAAHTT